MKNLEVLGDAASEASATDNAKLQEAATKRATANRGNAIELPMWLLQAASVRWSKGQIKDSVVVYQSCNESKTTVTP